jgi:hypothetical protein
MNYIAHIKFYFVLKMIKKSKRRIVREKVLQILYAYELNNESLQAISSEILIDVTDESDKAFAKELTRAVLANVEELDKSLESIDKDADILQEEIQKLREEQQNLIRDKDKMELLIENIDTQINKYIDVFSLLD